MLNISNLKEGDTVVFGNGGRSCAEITFGELRIAGFQVGYWDNNGKTKLPTSDLDIVEIIPKPEPVVRERYINYYKDELGYLYNTFDEAIDGDFEGAGKHRICTFKITVIDGVPSINKVEGGES